MAGAKEGLTVAEVVIRCSSDAVAALDAVGPRVANHFLDLLDLLVHDDRWLLAPALLSFVWNRASLRQTNHR